jgi:hypothetical protein
MRERDVVVLNLERSTVRAMHVDLLAAAKAARDHGEPSERFERWADILRAPATATDPFYDGKDPIEARHS